MWQAYGQSKTANSLMAISLAELLGAKHNLTSLSLHPGVVNSNMVAQVPLSAIQSMSMAHMTPSLLDSISNCRLMRCSSLYLFTDNCNPKMNSIS